jgi:folate-dependent phosphoribosylglycinamide formyltransferase PurN
LRLLLTAGFDGSLHAVALAELATRQGHEVATILIVNPLNLARVVDFARRRGAPALAQAARRLLGRSSGRSGDDELRRFLESHGIAERKLSAWSRARHVPVSVVADLNSDAAIRALRASRCDGVLYAGGGILRQPFIAAAGGRILNPHSGPLPDIRGMNACEWSLLLGLAPTVTVHFIDAGIDTGGVVERIPIAVEPGDTVERLRARCVIAGIDGMLRAIPALGRSLPATATGAAPTRQCFTLAPVLLELLESRLRAGDAQR